MPAYRSSDEADVRNAIVAKLRSLRPKARIIHEINDGGSNRFDLLAVTETEIIACEIKSKKDTLDLFPAQQKAMNAMAHQTIVGFHEKHSEGIKGIAKFTTKQWAFPEPDGDWFCKWNLDTESLQTTVPPAALNAIWKDELLQMCSRFRISATSRSRCTDMRRDLAWFLTGKELTLGVCAALRTRNCVEADPPIPDSEKQVA